MAYGGKGALKKKGLLWNIYGKWSRQSQISYKQSLRDAAHNHHPCTATCRKTWLTWQAIGKNLNPSPRFPLIFKPGVSLLSHVHLHPVWPLPVVPETSSSITVLSILPETLSSITVLSILQKPHLLLLFILFFQKLCLLLLFSLTKLWHSITRSQSRKF